MAPVSWRVIIYRLPAEPSRHRVAIWRELRRLGAVPLQQGTWAVPQGEGFDTGFAQVTAAIQAAGGHTVVLAVGDQDAADARLEAQFTGQREAEWTEFVADCGKYEAELDEEEQSLDRLRRWYRTIRARDLFGAPSAPLAERRLKECAEALERFAEQVYQARDQGGA
ncbi:MAG: chromate resistance protein ChrB [Kitasatospora sp.]|nr:chromate resistance protein ChrB [Kitasatospora sp.]